MLWKSPSIPFSSRRTKKGVVAEEHNRLRSDCSLIVDVTIAFNYLPNDKILDLSKLKAFADDKNKCDQGIAICLGREENIVGNGENAGYQYFLLFPQCFQKASFTEVLKVGIV